MRRAVLTLGGTVAGLAALFSFKTHVPGVTPVAATSTPTGLSASAPPTPAASSRAPASASPSKKAKKTAPKASPSRDRDHSDDRSPERGAVKLRSAAAADHGPGEALGFLHRPD